MASLLILLNYKPVWDSALQAVQQLLYLCDDFFLFMMYDQ